MTSEELKLARTRAAECCAVSIISPPPRGRRWAPRAVCKALQAPARQIFENAGTNGSVVVGKIRDNSMYAYGYNAQLDRYGDLVLKV